MFREPSEVGVEDAVSEFFSLTHSRFGISRVPW